MSIKYRTSAGTSASNFTDLVVKVGDTLPIGSEIDYDGQTAPAGWQEVDETNLGDVVVDSIRSKNMLDTRQCFVSSGTITIHDNSNGVIDIEGTNGYYARVSVKVDLKPNTNYTIKYKGEIKSGSSDPVCAIKKLDNSTTIDMATGTGYKTITFTTTETGAYICFYATQAYNTGRIKYSEIQLEEGDTATTYSLYQELNNQDVYSTVEQRVGTWIDGKPIYRKYVSGTTPNNSTTDLVLNVDTLVNFNIIVLRTNNNQWHPITSAMTGFDQNHACPVYYVISTTRVSLFINNSAYASQPYKGWVEYTKTTD